MCSLTPPSPAAWWGRVRLMLPSAPCPEERDLPRGKAGWQCSSAAYGAGKLVKEEQYLLFYYCPFSQHCLWYLFRSSQVATVWTFLLLYNSPLHASSTIPLFYCDKHLSFISIFSITNNAVTHILVQVFWCTHINISVKSYAGVFKP